MIISKEHTRIASLTLAALLNSLTIALVALQFVVPPAFVMLICIVPAVFALQALWTSPSVALLSALLVVATTLALFGLAVGAWSVIYVVVGLVAGLTRRIRFPAPLRVAVVVVTAMVLVGGIILLFAWFADIPLEPLLTQPIMPPSVGRPLGLSPAWLSLGAVALGGLLVLALAAAVSIDRFMSAVLARVAFARESTGSAAP